jgi:hypothetical protein
VTAAIQGSPVYDATGLMPDRPNTWIRSEKGIRRLQACEMAKAKGMPGEWTTKDLKWKNTWIQDSTSLHIWTTALGAVSEWFEATPTKIAQEAATNDSSVKAPTANVLEAENTLEGAQSESKATEEFQEWSWQVPNIGAGGSWYNDRTANLCQAVATVGSPVQLYLEGWEILEIHRRNYSTDGPKILQLIWWEFPPESWIAIREGSSMNFMVTPGGELKPNASITEEERMVTCKFVDKLIRLKVLIPAVGKLRANCPLFCVEKPHEPGVYLCIADAKSGSQNACMGKDPVYLPLSDDILPRLYHGGWTAVADASKHFHNFLTKTDERQYLGCIHPIHKTEWMYRGLPTGTAHSPAIACRLGNSGARKL